MDILINKESRGHKRVELFKKFHGVCEKDEFDGLIKDISGSGASIAFITSLTNSQLNNFDFLLGEIIINNY